MWLIQHQGLHSAPLTPSPNQHILDIGTGTGIWAIAYATEHPKSHVLGLDIQAPQPKSTPPNCTFIVSDAERDWPPAITTAQPFALIHARMLVISIRDWPHFLARCLHHLVPGGWLEINDIALRFFASDPSCGEAQSPAMKWFRIIHLANARRNGINIHDSYLHAQRMRDLGFADVREQVFTWRFGRRKTGQETEAEGDIGELLVRNFPVFIDGVTDAAIKTGKVGDGDGDGDERGMTVEEARALAEEAKKDVREIGSQRGYYLQFVTYLGQKKAGG
ncbi:MAG: hypothetical protein Q9160_007654 [Pyrenula sp. 1 TL-2023]